MPGTTEGADELRLALGSPRSKSYLWHLIPAEGQAHVLTCSKCQHVGYELGAAAVSLKQQGVLGAPLHKGAACCIVHMGLQKWQINEGAVLGSAWLFSLHHLKETG